jgi:very-short-patch-repair endonuclease
VDDALTRADLVAAGWTGRAITDAVKSGALMRIRRGHYGTSTLNADVERAVRVGGRLGCVSELEFRGVWVLESTTLHVHVAPNAARLRNPDTTTPRSSTDVVVHWLALVQPDAATASHVGVVDALARAADCLPRREAIAAIDSALNLGLVSLSALRAAFAGSSVAVLLDDADPAAQSGLETIVRLLARELGFRVRIQVRFAGIGVADIVVEGWVVIETDGRRFHDGPVTSARDRRRDAQHSAAGRTALRFRYSQVVYDLPSVAASIIGAVRSHRRVRNSGRLADRAVRRAKRQGLA